MKKTLFGLFLFVFLLLQHVSSFASHIFGGELLYTCINDTTYRLTLTFYGDCGSDKQIFSSLNIATPVVAIYRDNYFQDTVRLTGTELGTEVSPVCPDQINNTKCRGGTLPGVQRFIYSRVITVPTRSKNWRFIFTGDNGDTAADAGRSQSITNIIGENGSTVIQLEAFLDNSLNNNSSPVYSTIPTPFYCVNIEQQYNQGALDADGDSIAFSLVPAKNARTGKEVGYIFPFSGAAPVSTNTGAFNFNAINGQMTFVPNILQDALVVCKVFEYRKGRLIGTSEREMTFVVLDNCEGTPPVASVHSVSGGVVTGKNVINICVGTPHLKFSIGLANPDGDATQLSNSPLPGAAKLDLINNNTPAPSVNFDWDTKDVPTGVYTFYLTINNNHCPIANRQTIAYTINVAPVPILATRVVTPTECVHEAEIEYAITFGYSPRTLTVFRDGVVFRTYKDSTGIVKDSLPVGNFTLVASSDALCTVSGAISIKDTGKLPLKPIVAHLCINSPGREAYIEPIRASSIIAWYNTNRKPMNYPPVINTNKLGSTTWYFTQEYSVCKSDTIPFTATIEPLPVAVVQASSRPETICLGDTIFLKADGGVKDTWTPENELLTAEDGRLYVRITEPLTLQVKVEDQYGCADSTHVTYKDIQYCCRFIYPNAFTPNEDGMNDGFRVVTYGNMVQYRLMIFNRWGQQVFESTDPGEYWDGRFNGMPADMGTYMYYFKGQCLTGNKEEAKGDVLLIR